MSICAEVLGLIPKTKFFSFKRKHKSVEKSCYSWVSFSSSRRRDPTTKTTSPSTILQRNIVINMLIYSSVSLGSSMASSLLPIIHIATLQKLLHHPRNMQINMLCTAWRTAWEFYQRTGVLLGNMLIKT